MNTNKTPEKIRPIVAHGVDLRPGAGDSADWVGDCPFCGKEGHFFANPNTGLYDCKVCGANGNAIKFMTEAAKRYAEVITRTQRAKLSTHRGIPAGILKEAGVGFDPYSRSYMVPCFSKSGTVHDIRRYSLKTKKLMSTPGAKSQLWGTRELAAAKKGTRVWLCEGEWDGMAMKWLLRECGVKEDVVVAVPGAKTFKKDWPDLFEGMDVVALFDNDATGDEGAIKAHGKIKRLARQLRFVHWPDTRPSGFDLRDFVIERMGAGDAEQTMKELMAIVHENPRHATAAEIDDDEQDQYMPDLPPLVDMELSDVIETFEDAILMTDEMQLILKLMLAVALSNDVKSDPVWLYIVGPPGSGKTLLLTAFQGSRRCLFRSTLTPASLVSGWKGENGRDPSLIPKLNGKTLIAKDFTEILDMPTMAQDEIFSTLRGAFDGHVQKSFGNGVNREYHDCHFSILAGVTHAIHGHRKAHLGERFLRFEMTDPNERYMDQILRAAIDSIGEEHSIEVRLQHAVASFLQKKVEDPPPLSQSTKTRLQSLVKLIAILRSQVERDPRTGEVSYKPRAELGTRLAKQLAKLGSMLAFIDGKDEADDEVFEVLCRVAFNTVGGYSLDILDAMMGMNGRATRADVAEKVQTSTPTLYRRFEDLQLIGAIAKDVRTEVPSTGGRPSTVYEVSNEVAQLWTTAKGMTQWRKAGTTKSESKSSTRRSARRSSSRSDDQASRSRSQRTTSARSTRTRRRRKRGES